MGTKSFLVNLAKDIAWPITILILGWKIICLFSTKTIPFNEIYYLPININWDVLTAIGTVITAFIAIVALRLTKEAGIFEKTPNVLASGTFIISTRDEKSNKRRDDAINDADTIHTLQLINVGRGLAKNATPSIRENVKGEFLEDVCPNSYALSSGKSTKELGEILRVHGQRFIGGKKKETIEIKTEKENETGYFYIDFEDHFGKIYKTKVKINKVRGADGKLEELRVFPGIEIWKVTDNTKVEI